MHTRRPTAWTCSLGFLADRSRLYLGTPGRLVYAAVSGLHLSAAVIDMPQINQFALGVAVEIGSPVTPAALQ